MNCGVFIRRILEFNDSQGQAVYEYYYVRPPVLLALDDCELVHGQEFVVLRVLEVHQPNLISGDGAVFPLVLYIDAFDELVMKSAIVDEKRRRLLAGDFAYGLFQGIRGHRGIEAAQGIAEVTDEEHLLEGLTLGCGLLWCDVGAEDRCVAKGSEPGEGGFFYIGFSEWQGAISPSGYKAC